MDVVERYIYAVTQKLAQSQRKDIARELRSLIEDMVDERSQGKQATESEIEEVLLELGSPQTLAKQYRGTNRFLIGPELFDSYLIVLKIVLITTAIMIGVGFAFQVILDPVAILDYFIEFITSTVIGIPMAFGWTTLGFALAEHYGGVDAKDFNTEKNWTPSDLAPVPNQKGRISRSEPIAGIIFYTIFILFFTLSTNYFGVWIFNDGFSGTVPFINEEANLLFLIFIIIVLGFGILKESLKLVYGRWNVQLVVFTLVLNIISFLTVIFIITQPDFWNPNFMQELIHHNLLTEGSEAHETVQTIWNQSTKWIPVLFTIGLVWDVLDGAIKAYRSK